MPDHSRPKGEKVASTIPNWVAYVLLSLISLLIANFLHGAVVAFTATGILMLFVLSYFSKPVAEIQPSKAINVFEKNKINSKSWNNTSEPNAQRKRYLKALKEETRRAA